jgi:CheY-like chemotaxis protein
MTMLDLSQVAGLRLVDPGRALPAGLPQAASAPDRVPARAPAEAVAIPAASESAPPSEPSDGVASAPISDFEAGAVPGAAAPPAPAALPAPAASPSAGPVQSEPAVLREQERAPAAPAVLIVDDNVRLASTVVAYMEMQGFRAHPAHSAEEALFAAQQVPFDLVLLDINMPGMDGLEVCHRLLATSPGIRVLMVTGRDSDEDPLRAAAVGARGLLTKPISLASLRDEMLRALAS